jgi:serine/threonine-protein kinase RsbW
VVIGAQQGLRGGAHVTMAGSVADASLDVVQLDVPAHPAYVAVVRTAAAGLAARADLTLDRIEDLRIAVDEACALLLHRRTAEDAVDEATIRCLFTVEDDALTVDISGPQVDLPEPSAFAWAVLDALVDALRTGEDADGEFGPSTWLRLSVRGGTGSWT